MAGAALDPRRRLTAPAVLARGAATNLLAQVLPILAGLALTPFIVGRLGPDAFGVLSLGWTVLVLSGVFNLGLGRATTKYAAEYLASGRPERLPALFWSSTVLNIALGIAAAAIVAVLAVLLIGAGWLKVPAALAGEATWLFVWLSLALPFVFVTSTLRGMLEAGQHFDEVNLARFAFNLLLFALPAVVLAAGGALVAIGLALSASRALETLVLAWLCRRQFPALPWTPGGGERRALLAYGGWLTVTNALLPLLMNVDRFAVSAIVSIGALAFYSVAADLVMRAAVLPSSVATPLFPAFSALSAAGDPDALRRLYARSIKYIALGMAPVVAIAIVGARPFLHAWLGPAFAVDSTRPLQVLAVGVLFNAVAYVPSTVLQAVGRPDLTAKSHLVETPLILVVMWALTRRHGIDGAALATSMRLALDLVILSAVTVRLGHVDARAIVAARGVWAGGLAGVLVAAAGVSAALQSVLAQWAVFLPVLGAWAAAVWWLALDGPERARLSAVAARPSVLFAKRGADGAD